MNQNLQEFLEPTPTVNSDHPDVVAYAKKNAGSATDERDIAVKLYYAVRDDIRYDPYALDISVDGLKASKTLATGRGWCVFEPQTSHHPTVSNGRALVLYMLPEGKIEFAEPRE